MRSLLLAFASWGWLAPALKTREGPYSPSRLQLYEYGFWRGFHGVTALAAPYLENRTLPGSVLSLSFIVIREWRLAWVCVM